MTETGTGTAIARSVDFQAAAVAIRRLLLYAASTHLHHAAVARACRLCPLAHQKSPYPDEPRAIVVGVRRLRETKTAIPVTTAKASTCRVVVVLL